MNIEDLSFSNIVNVVDNDVDVGREFLIQVAKEKEIVSKNISELEIKLQSLKTRERQLKSASSSVLNHLKIKNDNLILLTKEDFVVVIKNGDIFIERNVM